MNTWIPTIFVLAIFPCIHADCPDFSFRCPTGERFIIGTCFSWSRFGCFTCRNMKSEVRSKCRRFECGGSVNNWYGRDDGCSAPIVGNQMTEVFRFACGIHDICYSTPGRSQFRCDLDFLYNMLQTCRFPGLHSIGYALCSKAAYAAYAAVASFGHNFEEFAKTCQPV